MTHAEMVIQLKELTLLERLELVELVVQQIRAELQTQSLPSDQEQTLTEAEKISRAVEIMLPEYLNNPELTIFSSLDGEDFYVEEPDLADKS